MSRRTPYSNKISPFVSSQFPSFVQDEYTTFIDFVEAYYEWMENSGNLLERADALLSLRDPDETDSDTYLEYLTNELLSSFPDDIDADKRKLLKNIRKFNKAKGTPETIKFLFRVLYGISTTVSYPQNEVLSVSNKTWQVDRTIKLSAVFGISDWQNLVGSTITQETSGVTAIVDSVRNRYENGTNVIEVYLHEISGTFDSTNNVGATYSGTYIYGVPLNKVISGLTIVSEGTGYKKGELLSFTPNQNVYAFVSSVDASGRIKEVTMPEFGVNYTTAPTVSIVSESGTGAVITASINTTGTYPGYYLNSDSIYSIVLQDSDFYQKYSYVIESTYTDPTTSTTIYTQSDFKKLVKSTVHPAGMKQFARINLDYVFDSSLASTTEYETETDTITADGDFRWSTLTVDEWAAATESQWSSMIP